MISRFSFCFRNEPIAVSCFNDHLNIFAVVFFRSQRLNFDVSSPNGILLFREASKMICTYGRYSLTFPLRCHPLPVLWYRSPFFFNFILRSTDGFVECAAGLWCATACVSPSWRADLWSSLTCSDRGSSRWPCCLYHFFNSNVSLLATVNTFQQRCQYSWGVGARLLIDRSGLILCIQIIFQHFQNIIGP